MIIGETNQKSPATIGRASVQDTIQDIKKRMKPNQWNSTSNSQPFSVVNWRCHKGPPKKNQETRCRLWPCSSLTSHSVALPPSDFERLLRPRSYNQVWRCLEIRKASLESLRFISGGGLKNIYHFCICCIVYNYIIIYIYMPFLVHIFIYSRGRLSAGFFQ